MQYVETLIIRCHRLWGVAPWSSCNIFLSTKTNILQIETGTQSTRCEFTHFGNRWSFAWDIEKWHTLYNSNTISKLFGPALPFSLLLVRLRLLYLSHRDYSNKTTKHDCEVSFMSNIISYFWPCWVSWVKGDWWGEGSGWKR